MEQVGYAPPVLALARRHEFDETATDWRGKGGRTLTPDSADFDRQLDKISIWLDLWDHKQVTSLFRRSPCFRGLWLCSWPSTKWKHSHYSGSCTTYVSASGCVSECGVWWMNIFKYSRATKCVLHVVNNCHICRDKAVLNWKTCSHF